MALTRIYLSSTFYNGNSTGIGTPSSSRPRAIVENMVNMPILVEMETICFMFLLIVSLFV